MRRSAHAVLSFVLACFLVVFSVSSGVSAADGEAITQNFDDLFTTSADLYSNSSTTTTFIEPYDGQLDYDESLDPPWSFFSSDEIAEPINFWGLDNVVHTSNYVKLSDLGFQNTQVFGFIGLNTLGAYYVYVNRDDILNARWYARASDGRFTIIIQSKSPIYGVGYNQSTGELVSFNGKTGLSQLGTVVDYATIGGVSYQNVYQLLYVLIDKSFGGVSNMSAPNPDNVTTIGFGQAAYPTPESIQQALEEERHEETKGLLGSIIDKIKEIPTLIIDGLKSLFVPSDGFFSSYFDELNTFFKDRFGFLYELPEFAITLFQKLIAFNPDESGYTMTFPKLQAPEVKDGDVVWHDISEEQTFDFTFLDEQPFKTLYSVYRSLIWLGYCVLLLNLIKRKSESVFGGGGSN